MFDPGNRRWHGRLVGVELPAEEVALPGEAGAVEVEVATSVVRGHELVASLEVVVPLEEIIRLASLRGTARGTCSRLHTIRLLWILLGRIGLFRSRTTSGSRPRLAVGRNSFRYVYSDYVAD